ncbi:MAG: hypothetical protein KF745_07200 [Phycisphaeraceae bacterium]|nr:hypothetical protein [Phycisphaeraceae bacterium]
MIHLACCALGTLLVVASAAPAQFRSLGTFGPDLSSFVRGMSADGSTLVGFGMDQVSPTGGTTQRAAVWNVAGIARIPDMSGFSSAGGYGASSGGAVIAGYGQYGTRLRAFRSEEGRADLLPLLNGTSDSYAQGITPDGSRIIGSCDETPCMWSAGGVTPIALPAGQTAGRAMDISGDGARIAAQYRYAPGRYGLYVLSELGTEVVPLPAGFDRSPSVSISLDGTTVVGGMCSTDTHQFFAFRWSDSAGFEQLPTIGVLGAVGACSADGSTVVGTDGAAVMWRDGVRIDLNTYLASLGMDLTGWTLSSASEISADGLTIGGTGYHQYSGGTRSEGWVATIPAPGAVLLLGLCAIDRVGGRSRRREATLM